MLLFLLCDGRLAAHVRGWHVHEDACRLKILAAAGVIPGCSVVLLHCAPRQCRVVACWGRRWHMNVQSRPLVWVVQAVVLMFWVPATLGRLRLAAGGGGCLHGRRARSRDGGEPGIVGVGECISVSRTRSDIDGGPRRHACTRDARVRRRVRRQGWQSPAHLPRRRCMPVPSRIWGTRWRRGVMRGAARRCRRCGWVATAVIAQGGIIVPGTPRVRVVLEPLHHVHAVLVVE